MPRARDFRLFERPRSYGFEPFDDLMKRLRAAVPDSHVRPEVLAALQFDGRQLDADQLAHDLHLDQRVVEVIEQLAAWGDRGELIHHFASVCIITITAGSLLGHTDLATFIFAQRRERGFALIFEDENGGHGELGEFERPLSLLESDRRGRRRPASGRRRTRVLGLIEAAERRCVACRLRQPPTGPSDQHRVCRAIVRDQ